MGQQLRAVATGETSRNKRFRLETTRYWYRLQKESGIDKQALIRWEYDQTLREGARQARHHVQLAATIPVPHHALDLNKLHVPTGWVTIEDVLRFLVHDLGMAPKCGAAWPADARRIEAKFYKEFTAKRYKPPAKAKAKK